MVDLTNVLLLAVPVVVGGVGTRLLVDHPGPVADLLDVHPWDLGGVVVGFHVATNAAFVALYLAAIVVGGTAAISQYQPVVYALQLVAINVLIVSSVLSVAGIYLDRQLPADSGRWRPTRWYYLMAPPLFVNAVLYGGDYLYQRRRHE